MLVERALGSASYGSYEQFIAVTRDWVQIRDTCEDKILCDSHMLVR
jgi:hypothetical protein